MAKKSPDKAPKAQTGATQDAQITNIDPVRQPGKPAKKPQRVVICKSLDGKRYYGEDWGDGKLIDRESKKEIIAVERTLKMKRRDPENPKILRTIEVHRTDFELKGAKKD